MEKRSQECGRERGFEAVDIRHFENEQETDFTSSDLHGSVGPAPFGFGSRYDGGAKEGGSQSSSSNTALSNGGLENLGESMLGQMFWVREYEYIGQTGQDSSMSKFN